MKKETFAKQLIRELSEEEWRGLENRTPGAPVSIYNRRILLDLRENAGKFEGDVPGTEEDRGDMAGAALRRALEVYLAEAWAEEPAAHKYVILACLALVYLYEKPMHPQPVVKYRTVVQDGAASYYCPAKEPEGAVCAFCAARPMAELRAAWEEQDVLWRETKGELAAAVRKAVLEAGFTDCGILEPAGLHFHEEIGKICEDGCPNYNKTWACPPAVGSVEECRARVLSYDHMLLFSKAYLLADSLDISGAREAMAEFKACARELGRQLNTLLPGRYRILSNESCDICGACAWPTAPCRHPDNMHHSIEGYGFNVSELAEAAGLAYLNGKNTVTFFGAVLYR